MALNNPAFKAKILNRMKAELKVPAVAEAQLKVFVDIFAEEFDLYMKTATITFPPGTVNVVGTAAAQSNVIPATGGVIT